MANKLELTWYGKDEPIRIEPRLLIENAVLSNTAADPDTENMIIHGDNLLALKALETRFSGQVKCIYIDPPYNVGAMNEHYDDLIEHSLWLNRMRPRLQLLRSLLCDEGVIFIQISDEEQAYLKVLCDEVFGRSNFVNMVSVNMKNVAGASGGGEDKKLKKNCEYILIYAKKYDLMPLFNGPYAYTEMSELIQQYLDEGKSWKYTTVLVDPGEKEYFGSTVDGDGNEIKVFLRKNVVTMSINQIAKRDGITTKEAYKKYGISVFRTTNAQSSNYDSAITKARTLLEETFCYVVEKKGDTPSSSGNMSDLYKQVKGHYNMHADSNTDRRINTLLSGLEKIVSAISEMRNKDSDAHGVGASRISIDEHHARLFVNAAVSMADFILSVEKKANQK